MAAEKAPKDIESQKKWCTILYRTAWYEWRMGNSLDTEVLTRQSMTVRQKVYGREHKETLSSMAMLGLGLSLGGRWKEAEELEVQVMQTRKRVLGEEHPSTLSSMNNLAITVREQGRNMEAL
jgi:hypothetical protein